MDKHLEAAKATYIECRAVIGQAAVGIAKRNEYCGLDQENNLIQFDGRDEELKHFVVDYSEIIGEVADRICREEVGKIDGLEYEDIMDN